MYHLGRLRDASVSNEVPASSPAIEHYRELVALPVSENMMERGLPSVPVRKTA